MLLPLTLGWGSALPIRLDVLATHAVHTRLCLATDEHSDDQSATTRHSLAISVTDPKGSCAFKPLLFLSDPSEGWTTRKTATLKGCQATFLSALASRRAFALLLLRATVLALDLAISSTSCLRSNFGSDVIMTKSGL